MNEPPDSVMPIKATPYQHQREAFAFARRLFGLESGTVLSQGAAFLMEMGTGKTITSIAMSCYSGTVTSALFENNGAGSSCGSVMKVGLQYISTGTYPQSASAVLYSSNSAVASIAGRAITQVASASDSVSDFNWYDMPLLQQ